MSLNQLRELKKALRTNDGNARTIDDIHKGKPMSDQVNTKTIQQDRIEHAAFAI